MKSKNDNHEVIYKKNPLYYKKYHKSKSILYNSVFDKNDNIPPHRTNTLFNFIITIAIKDIICLMSVEI